MRCAKCGHEVDPESPECPYCAAGAPPLNEKTSEQCPFCGSIDLVVIGRSSNLGCGCLGLLLWLLGFPFAGERIVCRTCGAEWRRRRGCLPFLSVLLISAVAAVGLLEFGRGVFL